MISNSHHTICVTDSPGELLEFLQTVLGLPVAAEFPLTAPQTAEILDWPEQDNPGTQGWLLGSGTSGLVEVIAIPESLRGVIQSGIAMVSFAVPDLAERLAAFRAGGFETGDLQRYTLPSGDVSASVVNVGGIAFEFTQFHEPAATGGRTVVRIA